MCVCVCNVVLECDYASRVSVNGMPGYIELQIMHIVRIRTTVGDVGDKRSMLSATCDVDVFA